MASLELDPLFLKAISLLHSKHPDSCKQLNDLVQEYREKTYGSTNIKRGNENNGRNSPHVSKVDPIKQNTPKHSPSPTNIKEKKSSSSPVTLMEKLEEITNFSDENSNGGKPAQIEESIEETTVGTLPEPSRKKLRQSKSSFSEISTSDAETNDSIPIDDIIEMDFDGPMCSICHLNKRNEEGNLLVECSECHSHFHQRCHKPNVSTKDLNDPRLIWYCSRCTKKMKKEMAAQQQSSSSHNGKNNETTAKIVSNPFQQAKPFRRNLSSSTEPTKSVSDLVTKVSTISSSSLTTNEVNNKEISQDSSSRTKQRPVSVSPLKRFELVKKKRDTKMQQILKQSRK